MAVLYILTCVLVGYFGRHRKFGFIGFFIAALVCTPVITGLILLITASKARPDKVATSVPSPRSS